MKEDIDEFRKRNGNEHFTTKEIVMGISTKVDKVQDRVSFINASQKYIWISLAALSTVVFFIVRHLISSKV